MPGFNHIVDAVGVGIDAVGVGVIVIALTLALVRFLASFRGERPAWREAYRSLRQDVGRGVLLGLEFLVAADIIRTVAVDPTLENVGVLGLIVVIRTFLSVALEVELEGHWPWRQADHGRDPAGGP
jgi:uncharacterized membrane protein